MLDKAEQCDERELRALLFCEFASPGRNPVIADVRVTDDRSVAMLPIGVLE